MSFIGSLAARPEEFEAKDTAKHEKHSKFGRLSGRI